MKTHGGARKKAGRKAKYIEKTETVSFRVPIRFIDVLKDYVRSELKKYEKPNVKKC